MLLYRCTYSLFRDLSSITLDSCVFSLTLCPSTWSKPSETPRRWAQYDRNRFSSETPRVCPHQVFGVCYQTSLRITLTSSSTLGTRWYGCRHHHPQRRHQHPQRRCDWVVSFAHTDLSEVTGGKHVTQNTQSFCGIVRVFQDSPTREDWKTSLEDKKHENTHTLVHSYDKRAPRTLKTGYPPHTFFVYKTKKYPERSTNAPVTVVRPYPSLRHPRIRYLGVQKNVWCYGSIRHTNQTSNRGTLR